MAKTTTKIKAKVVKKPTIKKLKVVKPVEKVQKAKSAVVTAEPIQEARATKEKYFEAVGRRKSAIARVRLYTKKSSDQETPDGKALILIYGSSSSSFGDEKLEPGKPYFDYFKESEMQNTVDSPLKKLKSIARFKATVLVNGGGMNGQAVAIRHGLSRALVLFDENFSKKFRKAGYLTRDPREKERRKYGLKKARKAPRWAKR